MTLIDPDNQSHVDQYVCHIGTYYDLYNICWQTKWEIRSSPLGGMGMFATKPIEKNWIFCFETNLDKLNDGCWKSPENTFTTEEEFDAFLHKYEDIDHISSKINMRNIYVPGIGLCGQAIKPIAVGEEIYKYYGSVTWVTELIHQYLMNMKPACRPSIDILCNVMNRKKDSYTTQSMKKITKDIDEFKHPMQAFIEALGINLEVYSNSNPSKNNI